MKYRQIVSVLIIILFSLTLTGCNSKEIIYYAKDNEDSAKKIAAADSSEADEAELMKPQADDTDRYGVLCAAGEQVLFAFQAADSDRMLTICEAKEIEQTCLVYRFGTKEKVELEYPKDSVDWEKNFTFTEDHTNPWLDVYNLTFDNENYHYRIYEMHSVTSEDCLTGVDVTHKGQKTEIKSAASGITGSLSSLSFYFSQ